MPKDNEENENNISPEQVESSEKISISSSTDQEIEKKAARIAEQKLCEPFDAFNPISYLEEFYPELNPEFALRVMQTIERVEKVEAEKTVIDIQTIKELLEKESVNLGEKALESLENCAILYFMLRKAVPEILKDRPEDHLNILDVGGGPTIYQHIPLMGIANSITHSEYLGVNRQEIQSWKEGISDFDWKSFFSTFQLYLQTHPDIADSGTREVQERFKEMALEETSILEDKLREKIVGILPVNVFREDLGMEDNQKDFDVVNVGREGSVELITSNFCIESATANYALWQQGVENVTSKVPKGGFLLMTAIRNADWYKVGDEQMPAVPVNADNLSVELENQGLEIRNISELVGSDKGVVGYDGMVFVLAKRV
jgi:hypothetical protein